MKEHLNSPEMADVDFRVELVPDTKYEFKIIAIYPVDVDGIPVIDEINKFLKEVGL